MSTRSILRATLLWHIRKARRALSLLQDAVTQRPPTYGRRPSGGARLG